MTSARANEAEAAAERVARESTTVLGIGSPLTERVLNRLGTPRWLWIALWASAAVVAPLVLLSVLALSNELARVASVPDLLVAQVVIAFVVVLTLWGVGRLTRGARALEPLLHRLNPGEGRGLPDGGVATLAGPIVLTGAVSIFNASGTWVRYGPLPTLAVMPLLMISLLPIMTFVWTYLQLLDGLDRLGRVRLALDDFPQDRSLGLGPVGSLAFVGFALLFAAAVPILVTSSANLPTVAMSLLVVAVLVAMFFLSMWRLHAQMAAARARHIAQARALYAAAFAPLRTNPTLEALDAQATSLTAARELVERAERTLAWPVDEGLTAWMVVIVTGVVTSVIVRVLFAAAGL